jgi:hypothetical protein
MSFVIRHSYPIFRDFPDQTLTGRDLVHSAHSTLGEAERSLLNLAMDLKRSAGMIDGQDACCLSLDQENGRLTFCHVLGDGEETYYIADANIGHRSSNIEQHAYVDAACIW